MDFIRYILISSFCISLFYLAYRPVFGKNSDFGNARAYLLISIFLSLLIPLINYQIHTGFSFNRSVSETAGLSENLVMLADPIEKVQPATAIGGIFGKIPLDTLATAALWIYIAVAVLLVARVFLMLSILAVRYAIAFKVHLDDCVLLYNHGFRNTFSFFRWIFIHQGTGSGDDMEQIITHEKVHVNQFHSFDILAVELLAAVMWFNPFVWMLKNSLQLVHEYLADDGALKTGIDRARYQALLVNQVAEERLVQLSSSFNHSLIKKRIIMMTKSQTRGKSFIRLMALLPVTFSMFLLVAIFNGLYSEDIRASEPETPELIEVDPVASTVLSIDPPDTLIKKTIIKRISKDKQNDTIVVEEEIIITGEDADRERGFTWHGSGRHGRYITVITDDDTVSDGGSGKRREVKVYTDSDDKVIRHERKGRGTYVYAFSSNNEEVITEEISGDSVKTVKIIRRGPGGDDKRSDAGTDVFFRYSRDKKPGNTLYIVDGEQYKHIPEILNDASKIESVEVVKDKKAMEKYSKEPYEGIIIIKTKDGNWKPERANRPDRPKRPERSE